MRARPKYNLRPALIASAFLLPLSDSRGDDRAPRVPELKVETYTLPNGLQVILHEDHTTPVVGVNVWYRVGSKNERPGRTGFAHLFEHLMFQGSRHHDSEYFGPIEKVGAEINGSTNNDRTNYYETLPSNALELALWLESDRMGFLLPALTQAKLDNQRDVVKNERRESVDNQPYGLSAEKLDEAFYPPDHPYHHSVIGSMADLSAASLADVSAFFRTYYAPNNASLCIAGDIDVAKTKALVEKYFGPLPRGPEVAGMKPWEPKLDGPKHLKLTDRVTLPMARLVWPTVPTGHPDEKAIDVLAEVLGGLPKQNRLTRALTYDTQLAVQASAGQSNRLLAGEFSVTLLARPDGGLDEAVARADAEIERLKREGPTEDEVRRAQNTTEGELIRSFQSVEHKADMLNENSFYRGDPLAFREELAELFRVTPADVKRVANQYLTAARVRVDVTPGEPTPRGPEPAVDRAAQAPLTSPPVVTVKDAFDRSVMPKVGPPPLFTPPPVTRRTLSNGLELIVCERRALPILSIQLMCKGGETLVPASRDGLAALTASVLTEATTTRDSLALAGELSEIGAAITSSGGLESTSVRITTLSRHRDRALGLFADVVLRPAFSEKDVVRQKFRRVSMLRARTDHPESVAEVVFNRVLYGESHPYGRPPQGTPETVGSITREDLFKFHKEVFVPANAAVVVVGDTTADAVAPAVEAALKGWDRGKAPEVSLPKPPPRADEVQVYLVDKPSAAQSVLRIGQIGVPRKHPDYVALTVMNAVLGGQFSSRINLNLREDKGFTYGAGSGYDFRVGPGPFEAETSVATPVTKESLAELIKELTEFGSTRPVTDQELAFAKDRIVRGFPSEFQTTAGVASTLAELFLYDLPDDDLTKYPARVEALTRAEVDRAARAHLDPKRLTVVVVGDRAKVEGPLKTLPFVKEVRLVDDQGNPAGATRIGAGAKPPAIGDE